MNNGLSPLPAGVTDGQIDGGGLNFATGMTGAGGAGAMCTPIIINLPKNTAFTLTMDVVFPNPGESPGQANFGLLSPDGMDGLFFTADSAVSGTDFIARERHAGVNTDHILSGGGGTVAAPYDNKRHKVDIMYDGGIGAGGAGIWDVYFDFQQVAHLNPGVNFPQIGVGIGAWNCTNLQSVTVGKCLYQYNEPFCTPL